MKRLVLVLAAALAATAFPSAAQAAPTRSPESVAVVSGVLTYTSGATTVDTVALASGVSGTVISETTSPSGSIGTACYAFNTTSALCGGATSVSIKTLDLADTIANWSSLPGTLDGGLGDDTIQGGDNAETILGSDGNDTMTGGGGQDTVVGGVGDDAIDVRDGVPDTVECGIGNDTVVADGADLLANCEVVTQTVTDPSGLTSTTTTIKKPAGGSTTGSTSGADGEQLSAPDLLSPVTVVGPVTAHVSKGADVEVTSKGIAPFVFGCATDQRRACKGVVFIDAPASKAERSKKARKSSVSAFMARRGRYGSSPFKVDAGEEGTVQVKLTGVAMRAMGKPRGRRAHTARRGRNVDAVLTIAPKNARAQKVKIVLKG